MFISILWILVGAYFIYLGIEILFFKVTKRIGTLETHLYKNKDAFVFRVGLLELLFGIVILGASIFAVVNYDKALFTYVLFEKENYVSYGIIPLGTAIIAVIAIWINQKLSEVKIKPPKDNIDNKKDSDE